jgi:very-short-patch-repair endonuclease
VLDGLSEGQRHQRLYDDLRKKLLDLSRRNPMLNYKHRAGSRRQLRIVHTNLEAAFAELTANQKELPFAPLPEPDDIPDDELTDTFKAALGYAKSTDIDYLTRLAALDGVARQDDASLTKLERWLRDHIRQQLELPQRPGRQEFNLIEHARQKSIDPSYELSPTPPEDAGIVRRLQSMFFADELDSRLARIAADARLSEQETGLSTLFLAFGFLRWYGSNDSDVPNFAPLLLLPVQIAKRLQGRRAVYSIKAASETPEINLSLRELLLRNSPDVTRHLPDFDDEIDGIESYFDKARSAIDGLNRWRIERNLTLGHFAFGRLAMYEDLSPDNWHEQPVDHPLLGGLLRGSEAESIGDLHFASDYDLDDEIIENTAPILINDADGSQHSAIVDVMNGKNLVIEGPPGTGKSQTITNIIANALYAGQTVLFLADKLAALEVVKDRLDAAGLGDFCLELHSDKAHPKPIIESLKQRYDLAQYAGEEPNWREELQRLRSARGRVRDYLSALHGRDDHEDRTPFDLMWTTIAARRELAEEFDAVRRLDLDGIFSKGWHEIEREKDALKLYAQAVRDYSERHGPFASAVWSKAGFAALADHDPDTVADNIRDAYESGGVLSELLAATSSTIELDLPQSPKTIKAWVDSILCLPEIEEDYLLPQLSTFSLLDIEVAAKLASERMELVARPIAQLPSDKFDAVSQLARQLEHTEFMDVSPAEIVVRTRRMLEWEQSLIEGLKVFSQLVAAFGPSSAPSIATARDMASIVRFANTIPPSLDSYLWFDRFESKEVIKDGATRLLNLSNRDGVLRAKLHLAAETQWPPLDDLRIVVEVSSMRGLHLIGATLTGKRRRAKRVVEKMGGAKLTANDINQALSFVEDRNAFLADSGLSAAAGSAWSGLTTPLEEMVAVLQLRSRFDKENDRSSGFVESVYQALFSSNRKVVDALRKYDRWSGSILSTLREWPDSLESVPLSEAADWVKARVEKFTGVTARIQELKLAVLPTSFAEIKEEVDRRLKIAALESKITTHQVFAIVGEQVWLSANGCRSLQLSAQIAGAIATASPSAGVRARLFSKGAAAFRRSLDSTASAINRALEKYRAAFDRLSQTGVPTGTAGDDDAKSIVERLSPLMRELASLREWLEVARRRALLRSNGTDALVNAFENAGLSTECLPETFGALALHYCATRVRQSRPILRNMKSLDLENERSRFVTADNALKKRQREAVRLKLLKTAIPVGSGVGARSGWTDLQCLRNEFTKQARHLPIRRLLSRSGRATQAMKPCFMMSPLSLAKFLPSRIMKFDLLVIDEASQMKPEDSLGGLLRAKKVVVVGDPNQLPPSDFFSRVTPADEGGAESEDEADDIDAESILDWSLKTFQAPRRLKWHYRSRCESLIAFSNREFYSSKSGSHGDLVTFPNARPDSFAIDLVRVNGNYKASRNPAEVARVVEAAIDFMVQHADLPEEEIPTLGIVAINIEQRDAIREEFNRSGRDEVIERYLNACNKGTSKRGPEPFFVKNLENVQGDERDFIMISLTYGREVGQERVAQRFGPIARGQGHRRLNVLFTRARQRIVLFSSMGSDDVLVTPTTKRGVRVLRDYLRYVESRRLEVGIATGRDFDSDFERDVRSRLETRGFVVDPQVGVSGYRIDLGIRHPDHPAIYLAGVECDGAAFHSAKSARDRDRLRESVLRGKGWAILRVWSTDWFANAELQTDRLVSELRRLASRTVQSQSPWTIVSQGAEAPIVDARNPGPIDEGPLVTDALEGSFSRMPPRPSESARLSETEVKVRLRAFRDSEIVRDFPRFDAERCILREIMINKIVESRLDEPEDFTRKIPLWLRERTDQKQVKYLQKICSIVEMTED